MHTNITRSLPVFLVFFDKITHFLLVPTNGSESSNCPQTAGKRLGGGTFVISDPQKPKKLRLRESRRQF